MTARAFPIQCDLEKNLVRSAEEGDVRVLNIGVGEGGNSDQSSTGKASKVAARNALSIHLHAGRLPKYVSLE